MQSEASCSLNHHITTLLRLSYTPKFQNLATPHQRNSVRVSQCAVYMLASIETHKIVFAIVYSSNWMIVDVIGSIEYESETCKQPVMNQSLVPCGCVPISN